MSINIFGSRRQYHERCRFWRVDDTNRDLAVLQHNEKCDGIFYAREVADTFNASDLDSGIVEVNKQTTMIQTEDNVFNLRYKDIVEYAGEMWSVVSVKSERNNNASFYQRKPRRVWYIELRNGE